MEPRRDCEQDARNAAPNRHAMAARPGSEQMARRAAPNKRGVVVHSSDNISMKMGGMGPLNMGGKGYRDGDLLEKETQKPKWMETAKEDAGTEYKWMETVIPNFQEMSLRCLNSPFSPGNSIWLEIPMSENPENFVKKSFTEVYRKFQSMAPVLSFQPSAKELRCKGTYTRGVSSCTWETQAWRVDPSVARSKNPQREYIFEFRRKTKGGQAAFASLVQLVAVCLKDYGWAKMYGNGCEIFPEVPPVEDLGELSMPGLGAIDEFSMPSLNRSRSQERDCPISLDQDSVARMTAGIAERKYPHCAENMAVLVQCAASTDNREVLLGSVDLRKAVQQELMKGTDLTTCLNALALIDQGAVSPKFALPAVARSLMVHSGYKQSGYKGVRSRAVECTALRVMDKLASKIVNEDREKTLLDIEKDLRGKLMEEVFSKVKDIRICRTVNAF